MYVKREMTMHYFLRSHLHNVIWENLISHLLSIDSSLPTENDETLLEILLFGIRKFIKKLIRIRLADIFSSDACARTYKAKTNVR